MSVENPAVPLSAAFEDTDVYDALAGPKTAAGTRVNRSRALGYSAVWRGVNLIAGDVGRLPFRVYRRQGAGKEPDTGHQAARVMRRPNDYMTPFTFRQTIQAHALLDGNGYAYIVREVESARPLELLPLDPGRTWPVRANGELWYVSEAGEPIKGRRRGARNLVKIPATDMLHIKGLGFDGLCGYPVVKVLRETIGAALAARDYGSRFFANDARPGFALEVPANMKPEAVNNLRESWERLHKGVDRAFRMAILRDGVKLTPYGTGSARDAQLMENRGFDAREIANVLGVPPHKLGDPSRTAYNSLESENQSYHDDTLDRWLVAWEQECDQKLLTEAEKEFETHSCEFTRQALLRVNLAARGTYYSQAIQGGWLNRDEVRGFENLNPIPGGHGQQFVLPVNVATVGATPAAGGPAPAAPADPPAEPTTTPTEPNP